LARGGDAQGDQRKGGYRGGERAEDVAEAAPGPGADGGEQRLGRRERAGDAQPLGPAGARKADADGHGEGVEAEGEGEDGDLDHAG
jgi:hypothetical protein